ncbi:hypothetical protein BT96DRAFT_993419 [Gymnopus androsaceus JB14]|uniref:Uncharacterized protein n=1 Tax=Gymnopus androsaceus JB14 TaxID=1447944 RepID=A0A6A4HQD1_9AGAR|nr:hypothetical protein BT96DRAFT_993419 [Gymnopus androsaceus JB14]
MDSVEFIYFVGNGSDASSDSEPEDLFDTVDVEDSMSKCGPLDGLFDNTDDKMPPLNWDTRLDIWHDCNIYATARGALESTESAQHVKEDNGKKNFTHILNSSCTKHMTSDASIFQLHPTPCMPK